MSLVTKKPLFITIGAMKSGTSSLHQYLRLHPEVHMSWVKETNHFMLPSPPVGGLLRYRLLLTGRGRVVGETSPNYTKSLIFPGVAERVHAVAPDAKLIYILRDPVDRAISHYHHNRLHGREQRSPSQAFASNDDNVYIDTSLYYSQLERYLRYYRDSRILILDFEEMKADPVGIMRKVFEFIGVQRGFSHPDFGKVFHDSRRKRQPNRAGRVLTDIPVLRNLRYGLPWLFEKPIERPRVDDELRSRLEDWLREDARSMRDFAGQPFSSWSVFDDHTTPARGG